MSTKLFMKLDSVTTCYRPPGLSPGPGTPALLEPPPQPPQARTAIWPTPPAITGHHRPSTPQPLPLAAPPAITAVTTTSALGLGYHATSAPAPPVTPNPRRDPPSCIMITHHCRRPPLATPHSCSLLTAPPPRVSALPVQDLRAT
ncbi:hypothetical protein C0993_011276 [Termitomyces sp. T159_Od127]|nr:hypothetical protein C0993_011276 [Termitomyces sp. T159_Od127]